MHNLHDRAPVGGQYGYTKMSGWGDKIIVVSKVRTYAHRL